MFKHRCYRSSRDGRSCLVDAGEVKGWVEIDTNLGGIITVVRSIGAVISGDALPSDLKTTCYRLVAWLAVAGEEPTGGISQERDTGRKVSITVVVLTVAFSTKVARLANAASASLIVSIHAHTLLFVFVAETGGKFSAFRVGITRPKRDDFWRSAAIVDSITNEVSITVTAEVVSITDTASIRVARRVEAWIGDGLGQLDYLTRRGPKLV